MIIEKVISEAYRKLKKSGIKTAKLDSEILMSKVIQKDRAFVILNSDYDLKKNLLNSYKDLIQKRSIGTPVSYLTGTKNFCLMIIKKTKLHQMILSQFLFLVFRDLGQL